MVKCSNFVRVFVKLVGAVEMEVEFMQLHVLQLLVRAAVRLIVAERFESTFAFYSAVVNFKV